jgi:hypothetical protein
VRQLRRAPARTAAIAITIAVPTMLAIAVVLAAVPAASAVAISSLVIVTAVVVVAQSSREPTSVQSVTAWVAAGADAFTAQRSRRSSMRIIGTAAVLVGAAFGVLLAAWAFDGFQDWGAPAVLVASELLIVFVGAAIAWRGPVVRRQFPRLEPFTRAGIGLLVAPALLGLAFLIPLAVDTDWDAQLYIPVAVLFAVVGLLCLAPAVRLTALWLARRIPLLAGPAILARRDRGRVLVRVVVVTSFVMAAFASVYGSSVGARDEVTDPVVAEINALPRVPPNVMALTYPPFDQPWPAADSDPTLPPQFTSDVVDQVQQQFPESTVVPVQQYVGPDFVGPQLMLSAMFCFTDAYCGLPVVVADPRLEKVYGAPPLPSRFVPWAPASGSSRSEELWARPSTPAWQAALAENDADVLASGASWDELSYLQVDASRIDLSGTPTAVRAVFVTRDTPYTPAERATLASIAAASGNGGHAVAITSDDASSGIAQPVYGRAPFAATDSSQRWSITLVAAVLALLAVVGPASIDAIDRWRDNERLEVIGARPAQIRGSMALHTGIELGLLGLVATAFTVATTVVAVRSFNGDATFPIPVSVPWNQLLLLAVVVPLLGVAISALVARPIERRRTQGLVTATPADGGEMLPA